ncbi:PREDICTED: ribosomal RNA-processing protein 7 homolog A [Polistes canadensis]|uniref:ribosomal RNA-processing protein 7 homolog A n=1 Tax=Polistes canadensis TaxID=91411 RepID=UPI000718FB2A|nr:PREDICTED: ribosomal RNA-processing protein 7 homolog A [Polistes canadensis]XP_014608976.1 PREDICTED: ribosomal RNA-processing protein 7 homolog A [Polistes canadensis]
MIDKKDNNNLSGYKSMWIHFNNENVDRHQLFLKKHWIKKQEPEYPRGRTLFLLNVPPYATTDSLKNAFTKLCGEVLSVVFTTPVGFKTAYIVFENESSLDKALRIPSDHAICLSTEEETYLTGYEKWCTEYNDSLQSEKDLKKEICKYMSMYDQRIADRIARQKSAEEAEEDGWVTVTSRKKRGKFATSRKESTINKIRTNIELKNRKKQLLNFYTFQIRESKKQHLAELRKKFELDKKKLQELKKRRTFKPF